MKLNPRIRPAKGERIMGATTFHSKPLPSHQCCELGSAQIMTFQLLPDAARAAPHNPPISAWLELDGSPDHQVARFHRIAPRSAQIRIPEVMTMSWLSMSPEEIVLATAVPHKAPSKSIEAASTMAWRGLRTLVETTVAIELAESWNPLMYSNTKATTITIRARAMFRSSSGRCAKSRSRRRGSDR